MTAFVVVMSVIWGGGCVLERQAAEPPAFQQASDVVQDWNRLLLEMDRHTPGYRPPVSARTFAYLEMAAYEAALPALPEYISLERYMSGYQSPQWPHDRASFSPGASVNAAYAAISRRFFSKAPPAMLAKLEQLRAKWAVSLAQTTDNVAMERSADFGRSVAEAVWQWSGTDTLGHKGHLQNYDPSFVLPVSPGVWTPDTGDPMPALLPYWGRIRPMVVPPRSIAWKPPLPFDERPGSAFYTEAMEVVTITSPLSKENLWVAEYWSDDLPGLTVTPAGRWISITEQAIEATEPGFPVVLETYLRTAFALCDAGIICWNMKYHYNLERPETYIKRNIRTDWEPLHGSPSFPAYPSGHASFGSAAAKILESKLGAHIRITDRTHENRPEFAGRPRTYDSFEEMMLENAFSRMPMGVHYRMDCVEGIRVGALVAQRILALNLKREEAQL